MPEAIGVLDLCRHCKALPQLREEHLGNTSSKAGTLSQVQSCQTRRCRSCTC
jgi:hypothetical protein